MKQKILWKRTGIYLDRVFSRDCNRRIIDSRLNTGASAGQEANRVCLKELWTLKWHRSFDTNGLWTKAGGAQPSDWPEWMGRFKDY